MQTNKTGKQSGMKVFNISRSIFCSKIVFINLQMFSLIFFTHFEYIVLSENWFRKTLILIYSRCFDSEWRRMTPLDLLENVNFLVKSFVCAYQWAIAVEWFVVRINILFISRLVNVDQMPLLAKTSRNNKWFLCNVQTVNAFFSNLYSQIDQ